MGDHRSETEIRDGGRRPTQGFPGDKQREVSCTLELGSPNSAFKHVL